MNWVMQFEIIGEVALAMLLGGVIGFEREMADKPAGFRTQMLVAGASAHGSSRTFTASRASKIR